MGKSSKRAAEEPTTTDATMVDAAPAKRSKKDKKSGDDEEVVDVSLLAEIAKPLAVAKVNKRVLKLVKKGTSSRTPSRIPTLPTKLRLETASALFRPLYDARSTAQHSL